MKLLVLAVEATAVLRFPWQNLSNFLKNVIKSFCATEKAKVGDSRKSDDVELSLVVFGAHGANRPYLVYQTDWANDLKYFFKWLSSIDFNSDEYYQTVAIAKGLSQVQSAFDHPPVLVEGLEKHCILVASSNPEDQLPTAETVAENFLHNSISISVICPTPHPKLEAIYNAARRNKSANYHSISLENIESGYTFLIADNLIEACPYLSSHSDLLANIPTNQHSLTDTLDWARDVPAYDEEGVLANTSPEWHQSYAPSDDTFCLYPQSGGPLSSLDNEHLSDSFPVNSFDHASKQVLSLTPLDDPFCFSPHLDGHPPSFDNEYQSDLAPDMSFDYDFGTSEIVPSAVRCDESVQAQSCTVPQSACGRAPYFDNEYQSDLAPDVSFDYDFGTSEIVPSAVRCDESVQAQSCTVPQSACGDLAKLWDINLSKRDPCLAPNHRPSWWLDSNIIATMIRSASAACNPEHIIWNSNPTKACPNCNHIVHINDSKQAWPGLPHGVKFDPSDPEIIEHLLAKNGVNGFPPHPFIDDFIPTIKEADGIYYTHPQKLPGVLQDGTVSHFFHKTTTATSTGTKKRRKIRSNDLGKCGWVKTGKTKPVALDGIPCGSKKIMILYTSSVKGVRSNANWVMHLYHLGLEENEKEGDYLISKVFCQNKHNSHGSAELQGNNHTQGDFL